MKRIYHLLLVLMLVTSGFLFSHAATNRYRIMWRDNPATTMVIGWNQVSGSNPVVYYGPTDQGTNWSAYPNSKTVDKTISYKGMNNQFARLSGLQPNQAYYFVIRDSEGTSQRFWFKTTPSDPSVRLSIIAGGDSRNNRSPRQNANKLVRKLRPHAVLFGGDMTNQGTDAEWIEWFDDWQLTNGTDGRLIPIIAARGNHESSNTILVNLFDVPSTNVYYALTMGGSLVRLYTLNTEMSIAGNQTSWLSGDLASNADVKWKIAQYHKPMRPHVSSKAEGTSQYTYWAPLFYQHKMSLVVECDAHTAKTTWPIRPYTGSGSSEGFIRDDDDGTVYVGEGCWGAPLRSNDDNKSWTRNSGMFNQFNWIFIDQQKMEVRKIRVDNADNVGTVNDSNIFAPPANLDIWSPSNGAVVTLYPASSTPTTPGSITISSRIATGNDDVEESSTGSMYMNSSDLELVYDNTSTGNQTIGMRFNGLTIPQGATITNAYVQFTVDETNSGATNLTIQGENVNHSAAFTSATNNVSSRAKTSASVAWAPASWTSAGQSGSAQQTPDLKNIVQQIVNRSGWTSGNSITLIITGTGERTAEAYEGSSSSAPTLYVTYSTGGSGARIAGSEKLDDNEGISMTEQSVQLDPNPFDETVVLHLGRFYEKAAVSYTFIDAAGINRLSTSLVIHKAEKLEIDTRDLPGGLYIIKAQVEDKMIIRKLIKKG